MAPKNPALAGDPGKNAATWRAQDIAPIPEVENPERRAYLMELDPLYCDLIVQRWEKFTGGKAERASTR